jgi:hypothetical protein
VADPEQRPTLIVNPADDPEFQAAAVHLTDRGLLEPTVLQDSLRERWPGAVVRPRELAGEHGQIWYVYRDGHWVNPHLAPRRAV